MQLRAIYAMDMEQKETEGTQYSLDGYLLCLSVGNFDDIDTQIDHVAEFVGDHIK